MPNINSVQIAGHLGRDAEIKSFSNGGSIAEFSVAVSRSWKDKNGEWKKDTDWINCKTNKPSDVLRAGLKKGAAVLLTGRIAARKFEHKGEQRTAVEVVADRVWLLSAKDDPAPQSNQPQATPNSSAVTDDDVPF